MSSIALLNPLVDIIFKKIFGEDKQTCLAFICAVLNWKQEDIAGLEFEFVDKDLLPFYPEGKQGFLDVLVKFKNGTLVNIEIQFSNQSFYGKRSLFYWSHKYSSQLRSAGKYAELKKVIAIHILREEHFKGYTKMHTKVGACDIETGRHLPQLADLEIHFIELSKFDNQVTQDTLTQWCLFLKEPNMIIETSNIDESIKRAYAELKKMSQNTLARAEYEERLKQLRDLESIKDTAFEKGLQEGLDHGLQQGLQKGLQQGLQQGMEKGREEGREEGLKTMIQAFYNNGFTLEKISEITALSLTEIEKILKSK
jgi:predicted transposase/invertase (TIGR01784 family)